MVAVDAVGSAVMGVNFQTVRHLQMASERGLGIGDLEDIAVVGESIRTVAKRFSQALSEEKLIKSYGLTDTTISKQTLKKLWER
jgi:uncharacterized protein (DUF362 family)